MSVVISQIIGGLGNQMFQYAAGLALARKTGATHKLDTSAFREGYTLHPYALGHLAIQAEEASAQEIAAVKNRRLKALPKFMRPTLEKRKTHYRNLRLGFDSAFESLCPPVYLEGYFQSERFFIDHDSEIRSQFEVATPPSETNQEWLNRIQNAQGATAIHVRRGDFVTDQTVNKIHGVCGERYYAQAADMLLQRIPNVEAFVFSDDPDWAEQSLRLPFPTTFIRHNAPDRGHEDLRLMSACNHFITANSTFSWWGAWLGKRPAKVVIAPRPWMNDPAVEADDLVPDPWMRVDR